MTRQLIYGCLLFGSLTGQSQEIDFQNANQSLIALNPSFAGSNGGVRNQASYRNQWPRLSGSFVSLRNSLDFSINPVNGGMALSWFTENEGNGFFTRSGYTAAWVQYFRLSGRAVIFVPSIQAAFIQKRLDLSMIHFGQPGYWSASTPIEPLSYRSALSVSTGFVSYFKSNASLGAYFFHVNQPDEGMYGPERMNLKSVIHGSYTFLCSERHMLQLQAIGTFRQFRNCLQVSANMVLFRKLIAGAGYSTDESVCASAGYRGNYFNALFSYDVSFSRLGGNTAGSAELHLSFNLRSKENRKMLVPFERM